MMFKVEVGDFMNRCIIIELNQGNSTPSAFLGTLERVENIAEMHKYLRTTAAQWPIKSRKDGKWKKGGDGGGKSNSFHHFPSLCPSQQPYNPLPELSYFKYGSANYCLSICATLYRGFIVRK